MSISGDIDEMSGSELLDAADAIALRQRDDEVQLLQIAFQYAVVNGPETVDPVLARIRGRARATLFGGRGTPKVSSFAPAELGARIGRSTYAGEQLVADALDLRFRLPQHWHRVRTGEVLASYARHVARRTRELDIEQAQYVDARVAEFADGRVTWSRFTELVEAAIIAADPEAAEAREKKALEAQFARTTQSTDNGMRGFYLRTDVAGVARLDATVAYLAEALAALGCTDPLDTRRAMAMVILANPAAATKLLAEYAAWRQRPADPSPPDPDAGEPAGPVGDAIVLFRRGGGQATGEQPEIDWSKLLPTVQLFVHLYGGRLSSAGGLVTLIRDDTTDTVRIEGIGTVTESWLRDVLGPRAKINSRPVLDIEGQAPVDSPEIPDRHRQAVRLMTPADVFPFSSATVNRPDGWLSMQVDHTIAFRHVPDDDHGDEAPRGQSRIGNYGPLTQFHHNLKTHGGWQVKQPYPGIYLWRDPHGQTYLVDHSGTRRIRTTRSMTPILLDLIEYDPDAA